MNIGDIVYIVENRKVRPVKVVKITRDFITVKYDTYIPNGGFGHMRKSGGMRLRRSRIFETEEDGERQARCMSSCSKEFKNTHIPS